jgi:hypothetical protein
VFFNKLISCQKELALTYKKANKSVASLTEEVRTNREVLVSKLSEVRIQNKVKTKENDFLLQKKEKSEITKGLLDEMDLYTEDLKKDSRAVLVSDTNDAIARDFHHAKLKRNIFRGLKNMTNKTTRRVVRLTNLLERIIQRQSFLKIEGNKLSGNDTKKNLISQINTQSKLIQQIKAQTALHKNTLRILQSEFESKFNVNY